MDGGLGHGKKIHGLSGKTKEETKSIDNYKDKMAIEHSIEKPIRIDCDYNDNDSFKYIKNSILNSKELNNLFDLNLVNWIKCEEFALSNLVKKACEYKRNNQNMTTNNIAKLVNLSAQTIWVYLKKGSKLDWCYYSVKEEKEKSLSLGRTDRLKPVILLINKDIRIFKNCTDLERQSEKIFGVKLNKKSISSVCLGKRNSYKGYYFKYIKDLSTEEYIKYDVKNKLKQLNLTEEEIKQIQDNAKLNQAI